MRKLFSIAIFFATFCNSASALTPEEQKLADEARAKYYNLQASGFESLKCNVSFDLNSAPFATLDGDMKKTLASSILVLSLDSMGRPTVKKILASALASTGEGQATQMLNVMSSLVTGVFQTWLTKGLFGPIPPFNNQINSVKATASGYAFDLNVPGAPVVVDTDKDFLRRK